MYIAHLEITISEEDKVKDINYIIYGKLNISKNINVRNKNNLYYYKVFFIWKK